MEGYKWIIIRDIWHVKLVYIKSIIRSAKGIKPLLHQGFMPFIFSIVTFLWTVCFKNNHECPFPIYRDTVNKIWICDAQDILVFKHFRFPR